MARVKSKQGKGGKKVDGKVSKSSTRMESRSWAREERSRSRGSDMRRNAREMAVRPLREREVFVRSMGEERDAGSQIVTRQLGKEEAPGHGANALKRMPCQIEGCCKIAQKGVYCQEHAGDFSSVEGCDKIAKRDGLCTAHHGGGYQKPCYTEGCGNIANKGLLQDHQWGGTTCRVEEVASGLIMVGCARSTSRRPWTQRAGTEQRKT